MKTFFTFVGKEFRHILRDRRTLLILFGIPVVQILIFGFALSNEVKNAKIAILDRAHDESSEMLITRFESSKYFEITESVTEESQIDSLFRQGRVKMVIVFPENLRQSLLHTNSGGLQFIADASDPNVATTLTNYAAAITGDYQRELLGEEDLPYSIKTEVQMLYNPKLEGAPNYVPGLMAMVLLMICAMMTSISIVREKELGTMEVLLVSPARPLTVILSKAAPYLVLSWVNLASILLLSVYALGLPIRGSIPLLFAVSTVFILCSLSLGLLISTRTSSQQSAMMISLMGLMLPTIMLSGFMFPIENFPRPMQIMSNIVPSRWYFEIVKSVMIKGLGFEAVWKQTLILLGITIFFLVLSLRNFKTRLDN